MLSMILRGLLFALSEVPAVSTEVESIVHEIASSDNGAAKANNIAAHASKIIQAVGTAVQGATDTGPASAAPAAATDPSKPA